MLILGCGYTGLRLAVRRATQGLQVTGIASSAATAEHAAARNIPCHAIDLDHDDLNRAPLQTGGAAVYLVPPPRSGTEDTRLARVLKVLKAERLVYVSTTGVYGNRDGRRVCETDTPHPESDRAVRRLAAETRARQWAESQGVPWVVLRVPGIYGPDRVQLATLRSGRAMLKPDSAGPGNRIHVDDLVSCIEAACVTSHTNRIYNVGDGNPLTNTEFVAEVAAQLGLDPPPTTDRATLREQVSPQAWSFMRETREVDVTLMQSLLGVTPRYAEPADGIRASLAAMGEMTSGA